MGIVNAKRSTTEAYNNRLRDSFPAYYAADVVLNSIDEDLTTKSWNIVMSGTPTENFKAKNWILASITQQACLGFTIYSTRNYSNYVQT